MSKLYYYFLINSPIFTSVSDIYIAWYFKSVLLQDSKEGCITSKKEEVLFHKPPI